MLIYNRELSVNTNTAWQKFQFTLFLEFCLPREVASLSTIIIYDLVYMTCMGLAWQENLPATGIGIGLIEHWHYSWDTEVGVKK